MSFDFAGRSVSVEFRFLEEAAPGGPILRADMDTLSAEIAGYLTQLLKIAVPARSATLPASPVDGQLHYHVLNDNSVALKQFLTGTGWTTLIRAYARIVGNDTGVDISASGVASFNATDAAAYLDQPAQAAAAAALGAVLPKVTGFGISGDGTTGAGLALDLAPTSAARLLLQRLSTISPAPAAGAPLAYLKDDVSPWRLMVWTGAAYADAGAITVTASLSGTNLTITVNGVSSTVDNGPVGAGSGYVLTGESVYLAASDTVAGGTASATVTIPAGTWLLLAGRASGGGSSGSGLSTASFTITTADSMAFNISDGPLVSTATSAEIVGVCSGGDSIAGTCTAPAGSGPSATVSITARLAKLAAA